MKIKRIKLNKKKTEITIVRARIRILKKKVREVKYLSSKITQKRYDIIVKLGEGFQPL